MNTHQFPGALDGRSMNTHQFPRALDGRSTNKHQFPGALDGRSTNTHQFPRAPDGHSTDTHQFPGSPDACSTGIDAVAIELARKDARDKSEASALPRMCPKQTGARTRAQSPNMVRSSKLHHGAAVVMRNMLHPFKFCEGKLGHVWHVNHGKRPIFWVIAQDENIGLEIAKINRGRRSYYAPHFILMLQRFQLERCADAAGATAEG
jgi:hypothetical protein